MKFLIKFPLISTQHLQVQITPVPIWRPIQLEIWDPMNVNGDIYFDIGFGIRGRLIDTTVNGHITFENESLQPKNITLHLDGGLKISIINVDINLDLEISYSPSIHIIDFPLELGKQWKTKTKHLTYRSWK